MSNDNWKNMIRYEIDKLKKDSYGKYVKKEMTADEYLRLYENAF